LVAVQENTQACYRASGSFFLCRGVLQVHVI
jgi:hypothetical protein